MPYYGQRGDYATYGYAQRGDPGFLSSLWKGVKRVVAPAIGFAIAGPAGAALGGALTRPKPTPTFPIQQQFAPSPPAPPYPRMQPPTPPRFGTQQRVARPSAVAPQDGCCPPGYHLAKDGSGRCVRNRRTNPANPRALRRAIRRVQGFEKLFKRSFSVSGAVKVKK